MNSTHDTGYALERRGIPSLSSRCFIGFVQGIIDTQITFEEQQKKVECVCQSWTVILTHVLVIIMITM